MANFIFCRRSRLCVYDVRPWKGIVELKGAEVAAATVPPAVAPTAKGATEGRTLVLRNARGASGYFSAASAVVSWVAS